MDLNIYYQNVRGLKTKLANIYNQISANNFDVIMLSETWLNNSVLNSEICDSNRYTVFRRDREDPCKTQGGGVLIAVSRELNSKIQDSWHSSAEDLWVTVASADNKVKIHICCTYIPPNSDIDQYTSHYEKISEVILNCPNDKFLIAGDYNLRHINWVATNDHYQPEHTSSNSTSELMDTLQFCNLTYNGIKNEDNRTLDLILSNINVDVYPSCAPVSRIDRQYHPPLELKLAFRDMRRLNSKLVNTYNFNKCNYEEIICKLSATRWSSLLNNVDVNIDLDCFYSILESLIKTHVPLKTQLSSKYPFWFSRPLIKMITEKSKYHNKWKRYHNLADYNTFSILRRRVKHV